MLMAESDQLELVSVQLHSGLTTTNSQPGLTNYSILTMGADKKYEGDKASSPYFLAFRRKR